MEITPKELSKFRLDLAKKLEQLEKKYQVKTDIGTMRFKTDKSGFKTQLTVEPNNVNGVPIEQFKFERDCQIFAFEKEDYNKEITLDGKKFFFIGLNLNARKNPCIIKDKEGNSYGTSVLAIKANLNK